MKIYKISQNKNQTESWYTEEVAKNTKDPKILTDILRRGNDDWISYYAVKNPNTPSEVLAEVLKKGKNDWVSRNAAINTKDPKILTDILRKGNNDYVSYYAVKNPNTPPEILAEILKRGKNDYVSQYAVKNPNCPLKEKILWMRAIGEIGVEDPNKHIIEYDTKEEEDEDLEKLRKLISKNINWYKKAKEETNKINDEIIEKMNNRWISVDSSWMSDIAYFEGNKMLEILLKNGRLYTFYGIPQELFDKFNKSKSKGEFFNKHIKNRYSGIVRKKKSI